MGRPYATAVVRRVVGILSAVPVRVSSIAAALAMASLFGCGAGDDSTAATGGCDAGGQVEGRVLRIATTVAPITSIVANIAGGSGALVTGVVPEGVNSHTYEPAPSVAATLEDADIVFLNGLELEQPTKQLAQANLHRSATLCELGTTVLPEDDYIYDFSFPESAGKPNPHLWTNPPMAAKYASLIRDVLARRDPEHAAVYDANLAAFTARVDALDAALRSATATIPPERRLLLTYHDAYAYFAEEYGWTVVGAIQPSSFDEPTPKEVAGLIEQIRERGVRAVFGSEVFPSPVLEQIAEESGARYVDDLRDDDLPGDPGDAEHSWLALMRFDFVTMVEALGGDATALRDLDVTDVAADTATYP
jgi:ABC-type Zn uptake system ZnuABC Zn-binding protein ZnuA